MFTSLNSKNSYIPKLAAKNIVKNNTGMKTDITKKQSPRLGSHSQRLVYKLFVGSLTVNENEIKENYFECTNITLNINKIK